MGAAGCVQVTVKLAEPQRGAAYQEPQRRVPHQDPVEPPPDPGGGNFVPVQQVTVTANPTTICTQPVPGPKATFQFDEVGNSYLTQMAPAGKTGFRGYVVDLNTGGTISNTSYYLQYFVNVANNGCCAIVAGSGTDVSCSVTAGLPYRFTAFFKTGSVPPSDHQIRLLGNWTP